MAKTKKKAKRKLYFRILKKIMKVRYKEPRFVYLGERFDKGALILSNHEGTDSPMSLEIYCDKHIRMWGSYEMNSGLAKLYKYQTEVYYHEKKHWNIHLARLFCILASPLTMLFYSGFDLISTYKDIRFTKTIRESIRALNSGDNIVVFPEDSTNGYLAELEGFHMGFVLLADICLRRGMDIPIYVSYFKKGDPKRLIVGQMISLKELFDNQRSRDEVAQLLCDECNGLGAKLLSEENGKTDVDRKNAAIG